FLLTGLRLIFLRGFFFVSSGHPGPPPPPSSSRPLATEAQAAVNTTHRSGRVTRGLRRWVKGNSGRSEPLWHQGVPMGVPPVLLLCENLSEVR
ncbi:hypothetical protein ACN38_g12118, partial [Penicillium nordicum]